MQFKDLSDEALQRVGQRIVRNAAARIRRQVPQRGRNPFATGALAESLQFNWAKNPNGVWELDINYLSYGQYTAFGTGEYADRTARTQGFFGMREARGYRRGEMGIRPQYWLSLRGDKPVYEAIVASELKTTWQTFLNNTITGFARRQA